MAKEKSTVWSGFWARLFAWVVDTIALALVCYLVGWLAIDQVTSWGSNGRAFGLALGVVYFTITASGLAGGRSIGMRMLGLRVSGLNGRPLGLPAAFGRAILLVGPMMLNGWNFSVENATLGDVLGVVAITAVFGVSLAQIYLMLFNRPTRRLVHDLAFGAVVVRADAKDFVVPPARVHLIVASVIILAAFSLALAAPAMLQAWMPGLREAVSPAQKVVDAVSSLPEISEASAADNTTTVTVGAGPPRVTRTLEVTARVRKWPANVNLELARVGSTAVKAYHFAPGQRLSVRIVYGFDLGFASYSNAQYSEVSTQCATADVKCVAQ